MKRLLLLLLFPIFSSQAFFEKGPEGQFKLDLGAVDFEVQTKVNGKDLACVGTFALGCYAFYKYINRNKEVDPKGKK